METLNIDTLEQVAQRFRLLSDPMRLKILFFLKEGECTVSQLVEKTGSSQPNVSKHLSIMRAGDLVKRRQVSNQAFFSVADPVIYDLCDAVCGSLIDEMEKKQSLLKPL